MGLVGVDLPLFSFGGEVRCAIVVVPGVDDVCEAVVAE